MSRKYEGAMLFKPAYFEKTGEFRPPKKDEYYLSGGPPQAWQAPNDLTDTFYILRKVPDPPKTITRDGFVYRLMGVME